MHSTAEPLQREVTTDGHHDILRRLRTRTSEFLQHTQLSSLQEQFGRSKFPVHRIHLESPHQGLHNTARRVSRELLRQEAIISSQHFLDPAPVREAKMHDLDQFHGTALNDLFEDVPLVEVSCCSHFVRVEATNVMKLTALQGVQQGRQVFRVLAADGIELLSRTVGTLVETHNQRILRRLQLRFHLRHERIVIFFGPALRHVSDITSVMPNLKAVARRKTHGAPRGSESQRHQWTTSILYEITMHLFTEALVGVVAHKILRGPPTVIVQNHVDLVDGLHNRCGVGQLEGTHVQTLPFVELLLGVKNLLHEEVL
mmetsp:Transcript_53707/g.143640  ORF Transcript_53707/g.143640 Transcript_53707/m.143640 type:complete len:314 (+) Transcript_53707:2168-3109(+)